MSIEMTRGYVCLDELTKAAACIPCLTAAILIFCGLPITAIAQPDGLGGGSVSCSGMVQSADGNVVAVELDGMGVRYRADVDGSGYFRLEGVPAGEYSARVIERSGAQTDTDFISLRRGMPWLTLRVPTARREISGGGTISAARLAHVVPKDARKELEKANKAVEK